MRFEDLGLEQLLEPSPEGGVITFAGQRAVVLDAVALGLLRKELIDTIGATAARGLLTRLGYAHGWRTAESLQHSLPWENERQWRVAGGRLHTLQGLVRVRAVEAEPGGVDAPFAEALWEDSYEAEQHLLHLGLADEPVCWTLSGFASGYLSFANGREIYCLEDRCRGRGDAVCHVVGRPADEWGETLKPHLPFYRQKCLDAALDRVTRALKRTEKRLASQRRRLVEAGGQESSEATSEAMRAALELCDRAARVDQAVLISGELGVGKEWVARRIHSRSVRSSGPLLVVRCSGPAALVARDLIGAGSEPGALLSARGGTLVLDEVGALDLEQQSSLVRLIDDHARDTSPPAARLVCTSSRDLPSEVAAGRLLPELLYRVKVLEIRVPPLRQRREDVVPLARTFVARAAGRLGRRLKGLSPEAEARLAGYDWPGNVRELENAAEHAVAVASAARVEESDLPAEIGTFAPSPRPVGGVRALADVEREYILAALEANGGNRARTATQLRIGPATLYRKLRSYGERT